MCRFSSSTRVPQHSSETFDLSHIVNGLRKEQLIRGVPVQRIDEDGNGVVHIYVRKDKQEFEFKFDRALPGEVLHLHVDDAKKDRFKKKEVGRYHLSVVERGTASSDEVAPPCEHFRQGCGGCSFQHLAYEAQIREKQALLNLRYKQYGMSIEPESLRQSPKAYGHLSRSTFRFFLRNGVQLGLHPVKSPIPLVVDHCRLHTEAAQRAFAAVLQAVRNDGRAVVFDPRTGRGWLCAANFGSAGRESEHEVLVTLVTTPGAPRDVASSIALAVMSICEEIVGVTLIPGGGEVGERAPGWRSTSLTDHEVLAGRTHLLQRVGGLTYSTVPEVFVRSNLLLAAEIYDTMLRLSGARAGDVVWDAFCGQGPMPLILAKLGCEVVAMDRSTPALGALQRNLQAHTLEDSVKVLCLDLGSTAALRELAWRLSSPASCGSTGVDAAFGDSDDEGESKEEGQDETEAAFVQNDLLSLTASVPRPSVLIADPGRNGLPKSFRRFLCILQVPTLIYVGTGKAYLADCVILCRKGYEVVTSVPFDSHPHTAMMESVVHLRWSGSSGSEPRP